MAVSVQERGKSARQLHHVPGPARRSIPKQSENKFSHSKGIDSADHVAAGLAALEGAITPRTELLIAHHMDAQAYRDGTLGHRAKGRLRDLEDFDDLMFLAELDHEGRRRGVMVCTVAEALEYARSLDQQWA